MNEIQIKEESLPSRCEICHQADCFDALANHCSRCADVALEGRQLHSAVLTRRSFGLVGRLLCWSGIHSWHYCRWERHCLRCRAVQHVWRVFDNFTLWRDEQPQLADGPAEAFPLPLQKWQCLYCSGSVMSVHPPGFFEQCPHCGKANFVARGNK
jgi:hypothetical protein